MGKTASLVISVFTTLLCGLWLTLMLVPTGWHTAVDWAVGFHIGLRTVEIDKGISSRVFGNPLIGKRIEKELMGKSNTIRDARELFCSLDQAQNFIQGLVGMESDTEWCDDWQYLEWSSWGMIVSVMMGIVALAIGAGLQHYYWHVAAFEEQRHWAKAMFVLGPIMLLIGIATYTIINFGFSPYGRQSDAGRSFSISFLLAWFATVLSFVPLLIQVAFQSTSRAEDLNAEIREQEEEAFMSKAYGAINGQGQAPAYGAPQSAGAQSSYPQPGQVPYQASPYGAPQPGPPYGAPQYGAPQLGPPYGAPQYGAPQPGPPQFNGGQYGVPQYGAPQYGTPQYGAP